MSAFSKAADIFLAFICMFLLPFILCRTEIRNKAAENAGTDAMVFLEKTATARALDKEILGSLLKTSAYGDSETEIEIERTEYIPGREEPVRARYSHKELIQLLDTYGTLPLKAFDRVIVRIREGGTMPFTPDTVRTFEKRI